ncbi:HAMP domain-containing sensor histidine kinase [Actinoplanes sp. NPDC048796]|uniref:HAMP domain-containing sensor histidine kinase n=1 Tax=unclassified Actinoplanes TaxID=2626549 RepID=UPI0034021496
MRSLRARLTVIYSTVLFALAGLTLGGIYLAIAQTTEPRPITERTGRLYEDRQYRGEVTFAEVGEIEAAVNYNTMTNLRRYSLYALGGLFVASLGVGWVLSGRALRPVGAITRTAREIQATDLSRRIRLDGPRDELRDLAETLDSMLDRLDHAFQAQRQLIDDASHELRSPLAIIRTNLDASLTAPDATPEERGRAVAVVDRATTRMSRLVEDLLATARREADTTDTDVDLAVVAREAGEESLARERGLRLAYATAPGLRLIGDADALRRAVGNLLSNAVRLAPPASTITVAAGRTPSWLWLAVADEGPGIAAGDLPRVFDRFWKGPQRGTERRTGLGLAIVRQIAESHGGRVAAHSEPGRGSTFVLWLPAAGRTGEEPPPPGSPWP